MAEKNDNGERRWLTWIVRLVLPALIAALWAVQWASLSAQLDDLRVEVRGLRAEMRDEMVVQGEKIAGHDARLARLETRVELLRP